MRNITCLLLSLFTAASVLAQTEPPVASPAAKTQGETNAPTPDNKNAPPFDIANMDTSVKPSDDFFMYANGGWIKRTQIPPEYSRWGSFNELVEKNNDALHEIAEKAAAEKSASLDVQKVGDFYASGMNEAEINAAGVKPLQEEMQKIDALKNRDDLTKAIARLHETGVNALFN